MDFYSMVGRTKVAADAYAPGDCTQTTDHELDSLSIMPAWYIVE